ncbi:hypothetical protein KEM48_005258 [Puccinia striiformis f. sp. tritici PST-130]|nr:hypothetical protein KEM48_005258 [Puccinia striiformis f. sp. tritici PST-130]
MLAFVRLNRNKNVYRRTTKQPIIIDVEVSDDSFSHQEEKAEKIKHHSTPGPAQRSRTTQILTPINQSQTKPFRPPIPISIPTPHRQPKLTDDSPLQFNQRGTSKPISTNHLKPNKPRHKVIFVRTLPHSPVVLIPRIPKKTVIIDIQQQQDSPISQQKTILPITKQYATSTLPAIPRETLFVNLLSIQTIITSFPVVISRSPFANQRRPTHKDINNSNNHGIPSLLKICNQSTVLNFTTTIETIDRNKTVMGESRLSSNLRTTKQIGRDKGSQVSSLLESKIVVKIIPIKRLVKNHTFKTKQPLQQQLLVLLIQMEMREIKLNQLLGTKSIEGFIDFKGKIFNQSIILLSTIGHAGKDLEASSLNGWQQAASILEQATSALSQVEEEYEFEIPEPGMSGVRVSLIDYGLSRAKIVKEKPCSHYPKNKIRGTNTALIDHEILWTDPDLDIFGAIGNDYQFECYDLINLTREDKGWDEFNPISNLIWLHYLTKKLIDEKSIAKPPSRTTSSAPTRTITKTAQKERRQTSSSTRARKTTTAANQKLKSSTAGNIRAREGLRMMMIKGHKVQLIHQRAKHSTNENNKKSRSSSDGSSLEEDKERNERLAIFPPQNHNKAEAKSLDTQYATVNQALLDKLPIQIASSTKIKQKNHLNLRGEENNNII